MAREYARVRLSIWDDPKFAELSPAAQHLYFVLLTDSSLSYVGVADWRPKRIAARAKGWSQDQILAAAQLLEIERFILFEPDTEEALVRTFIRNDELLRNPKMALSVVKAYGSTASRQLRSVIVHELHRAQKEHPEYSSWTSHESKDRLADLLELPQLDPSDYPNRITNEIGNGITNPHPVANRVESRIGAQAEIGNADRSIPYHQPSTLSLQPSSRGGYVSTEGHQSAEPSSPPPPRCSAHADNPNPPNCRDCGEARKSLAVWQSAKLRRESVAQSREAREMAELRKLAADECDLCDEEGYAGTILCDHDPDTAERARRGMEQVRALLGKASGE
ncbi:hypothetical protein HQO24_10400 [Rhodococcus fascians]|nr:hypothetical protein [Rhodococcus fascians]MBY4396909.1 hypothetical protein [Rhodococcus fascians]MBY4407388.1 hypothetical protein [Rhodococcus fascians]MBY4421483.1 hypothetical protein [Rhodococcus fascians]MBY4460764.1 hypothetical protein [Rhodococcus fascians]